MATQAENKAEAERLMEEGKNVLAKLSDLADARKVFFDTVREAGGPDPSRVPEFNQHMTDFAQGMDEQVKKAMGIWAQAQVYATLATIADPDSVTYTPSYLPENPLGSFPDLANGELP